MKKKIFGITWGTVLGAFLCLLFAFAFWFAVKYIQLDSAEAASLLASTQCM